MISIICPIFNCDEFLNENLITILNQDFEDFELKFIDNSSTDDSIEILEQFKVKDDRIEIYNCESKDDLSYKINECIKSSRGKYIYFWDCQYKLNRNAFSTLFHLAEENELDCLIFNYVMNINNSLNYNIEGNFTFFDNDLSSDFLFKFHISNGNNFILKSLLEGNIYFNGNFKDFFLNVRFASKMGMVLNEPLAKVNMHEFYDIENILNNFEEITSLFNWLLEDKTIFEFYKTDLLKYVLQQLKNYHDLLINFDPSSEFIFTFTNIKNEFFNKSKQFFDKIYYDYHLYEDIKNLNKLNLIEFFNKFLINKGKYRMSIVIPVFNSEKYLEYTLNSIINQTLDFRTIEVLLVDDCSSDNSASIMKNYSEKYSNFKSFFLEENSSYAGRPRNIALSHVSSNFVSFLDADDFYYEDACENLYYTMINYDADIVIGNYTMDKKDGGIKLVRDISLKYFPNLSDYSVLEFNSIKDNSHILNSANVWNKIFKFDIIEKNNIMFPEGVPAQDTAFLFRFLLKSNRFLMINEAVAHYHSLRNTAGDQSVTHRRTKLNISGRLEVYYSMYNASLEADMEEHFVKNLLVNKLTYLVYHIRDTDLSNDDIEEIFGKYPILYKKCIQYNAKIPKKYISLFKNIGDWNFNGIIADLDLIKTK